MKISLSTAVAGLLMSPPPTIYPGFGEGRGVSLQFTILKVLAGHPGGRLAHHDLTRAVAILASSGPDWTRRANRLPARSANLDIIGQALVLCDGAFWQITDAGIAFIANVEAKTPAETADYSSQPMPGPISQVNSRPRVREIAVQAVIA